MKTTAIILAAGSGSRMQSNVKKQYMEIKGRPLLLYAIDAFEKSFIDEIRCRNGNLTVTCGRPLTPRDEL